MQMKSLVSYSAGILIIMLPSCGPQRFYQEVKTGRIESAPIVKWTGPDSFDLVHNKNAPFKFHRFNGEVIQPAPIKTDGGSVPPQFWGVRGMTPWTYAPGYLVHDWLYEANRRGKLSGGKTKTGEPLYYERELCDLILAEVIKTQMLDPEIREKGDPHPNRLFAIYNAVKLFGNKAFHDKPNPVEEYAIFTQASDAVGSVVPGIVKTPLQAIGQQMLPIPASPDSIEGSTTPVSE